MEFSAFQMEEDTSSKTSSIIPLINKDYRVIESKYAFFKSNIIGSGSFGKVLYGMNVNQTVEYAMKFEKNGLKTPVLLEEAEIYLNLQGGVGIPKIHYYGEYKNYKVMVMDLLGPSLDKYLKYCVKTFELPTATLMTEQMISRIEYMHSKGYIHRDIKPNNFLLGKIDSRKENFNLGDTALYMIDFGLSKRYIDSETKKHYAYRDDCRFVGTPRYASVNTHTGKRQARRDDIESIMYVFVYFLKGSLPWQGIRGKTKAEKKEKIKNCKKKTKVEELCSKLPPQVAELLKYSKELNFYEKPNYDYIRSTLRQTLSSNQVNLSKVIFDWNLGFMNFPSSQYAENKKKYLKLYEGYPKLDFETFLNKIGSFAVSDFTQSYPEAKLDEKEKKNEEELSISI